MAGTTYQNIEPPVGLLAEVTHRCPLHCVYCSNPLEMNKQDAELSTEQWLRVLEEAAEIGVLQVHFSGGEPMLRPDILTLVERASELGLFTNLITSGIGLTQKIVESLRVAELGSLQLSFQGSDAEMIKQVADGPFWKKKLEAAERVKQAGLSLSINAVLHRMNIHQVGELIELAASLGAERIELANTQYYGWALLNRDHLLPGREQLAWAEKEVQRQRERYGEQMEIIWVVPDYYDDFPKPCMGGWGDSLLSITPDGKVLPCLAANVIPDLDLPMVTQHSLRWIWYESPTFNTFRGTDWMFEPCRSCPMKRQDHGGCRCQAFLLTGDATATDPVCIYAPEHYKIIEAREKATASEQAKAQYRYIEGPRPGKEISSS
jgi:pyrroloquinoline quinone biosynthesis protein E